MPAKNWDHIVSQLSSGDESDKDDSLNVMSVQKHAHRVVELLQSTVPA